MIEYLHLIQDAEGYLPTTLLTALSEELSLSVVEGTFKDRHYLERYPHHILEEMLIEEYCGGMAPDHGFNAYLPGGASGGILPARLGDIPLDFDPLNEYGCFIGSSAVIVLSDQDSVREVALNAMRFFARESCGQCTPCRVGTENARCLINLALMTGQIGRPGTGLHPLRGQNNVQGASDAGLIPMMFPDYQRVDNLEWEYTGPRDVFDEMRRAMTSIAGITWERLELEDVVTYPCRKKGDPGQPVIFTQQFPRADGRGLFVPAPFTNADELPDEAYPWVLITGRQLEHWHTGAMSRRSVVLDAIEPGPVASLHPDDLDILGVPPSGELSLRSRRGEVTAHARVDIGLRPGQVFLPFCYQEAAANLLTNAALDPDGKIPEFKFCAVRVSAAVLS